MAIVSGSSIVIEGKKFEDPINIRLLDINNNPV